MIIGGKLCYSSGGNYVVRKKGLDGKNGTGNDTHTLLSLVSSGIREVMVFQTATATFFGLVVGWLVV